TAWRSQPLLLAMGRMAGWALGVGRAKLTGMTSNGHLRCEPAADLVRDLEPRRRRGAGAGADRAAGRAGTPEGLLHPAARHLRDRTRLRHPRPRRGARCRTGCGGTAMTVEVGVDVGLLKSEIKKTYSSVSQEPERDFIFPTGRAWAEDLGYPAELANVPETAVESFAGVANPWTMGRLAAGERVLDLGSGAGTDSLIAAQMV